MVNSNPAAKRLKLPPTARAIALGAVAGLFVAGLVIAAVWGIMGHPAQQKSTDRHKPATRPALTTVAPKPQDWRDVRQELGLQQPVKVAAAKPIETTPAIPLPRYMANAVPVQVDPQAKLVVIVLDDMGVNAVQSANALNLPGPLTLSFLPYGDASLKQAKKAKQLGHEIMVHLPMEPLAHLEEPVMNPGPNALYVADDSAAIAAKVQKNLKDYLPLAVGVNNHMGSRFTSDKGSMLKVLPLFENAGLFYLDSLTTPNSQVTAAARELNLTVPLLKRDVFLDHVIGRTEVDQSLLRLEREARKQGFAIGIGHPHAITLQALKDWLPTLAEKGIQLVPISYIAQQESPVKNVAHTTP